MICSAVALVLTAASQGVAALPDPCIEVMEVTPRTHTPFMLSCIPDPPVLADQINEEDMGSNAVQGRTWKVYEDVNGRWVVVQAEASLEQDKLYKIYSNYSASVEVVGEPAPQEPAACNEDPPRPRYVFTTSTFTPHQLAGHLNDTLDLCEESLSELPLGHPLMTSNSSFVMLEALQDDMDRITPADLSRAYPQWGDEGEWINHDGTRFVQSGKDWLINEFFGDPATDLLQTTTRPLTIDGMDMTYPPLWATTTDYTYPTQNVIWNRTATFNDTIDPDTRYPATFRDCYQYCSEDSTQPRFTDCTNTSMNFPRPVTVSKTRIGDPKPRKTHHFPDMDADGIGGDRLGATYPYQLDVVQAGLQAMCNAKVYRATCVEKFSDEN